MSDLVLTVYEADDETPYFEVGTSPAHPNPYLCEPSVYAEAEVDIPNGSARIGRLDVEVIDPQVGATRADRWLTALLGSAEGYSQVNGRRTRLAHADGTVVVDGICAGATLHDSFAGFRLAIEDIRARGIDVPVFTRSGTTTVLPRGVVNGYGYVPGGLPLVPPTTPLIGRYHSYEETQGAFVFEPNHTSYLDRIVSPDLEAAARVTFDQDQKRLIYPDVEVWWRPIGEVEWRKHRRMATPLYTFGVSPSEILQIGPRLYQTIPSTILDPFRGRDDIRYVHTLFLRVTADQEEMPTHGTRYEVMLVYVGAPSERFPFHWEGSGGELLRNVMRGDYSIGEDGEPLTPGIRYDEDRLVGESAPAALRVPVRIRITEPAENLREWIEDACQALGVAPALNHLGEVSPVSAELPDELTVLPEINDGNSEAVPGWEHPITDAITRIEVTYPRDYRIRASEDPLSASSAADGILSAPQTITVDPSLSEVQGVMGVQTLHIDGFLFRAIGGEDGQSPVGELTDEAGAQHARRIARDLLLRYLYGGQSSFVRVRRSEVPVRVGDWVLDARSWAPNYSTGRRGRNHLAQVVAVRDINPAWRELRLIDAAPHANPVAQPTIGTPTEDAPGVVAIPVLTVPTDAEARVDYAVSPTLPETRSGLWTQAGRTRTPATVRTPVLPTGSIVWVRARGEQVGRRPSAWTVPVSVELGASALVYRLYVRISAAGAVVVSADLSALTQGVRIYYAVHSTSSEAGTLTQYQDFPAAGEVWTLEGVTVRPGQAITVELEPWTGWSGSAVSGVAGPRASRTTRLQADETAFSIFGVVWEEGDDGHGTLSWHVGSEITESWLGYAIVPQPETPQKWDIPKGKLVPVTSPVRLPIPREREGGAEIGLLWLEAKFEDPDGGGLATGDIHSQRIFPRTSIPAIDDETGGIRDGAINRREMVADGVITARAMREGSQTFNTNILFASPDHLEVTWSAGRVALAAGGSYQVVAGTTGPMPAPTWVYLDLDVSTSQLQTTRNVADTIGDRKVLLAYARPIDDPSQLAFYIPAMGLMGINKEALHLKSVTAEHIAGISLAVIQAAVNQLSAITADLGEVRTGLITNAAEDPTRAIRLSDEDTMPESVIDWLDLAAVGMQAVLKVGKIMVLGNGDTIVADAQTKTVRISHHAFRPYTHNVQYNTTATRTSSADGFSEWGAPVSIPVGATIKRMRFRASAGNTNNEVICTLYRQDDAQAVTDISSGSITSATPGTFGSPLIDEVVEEGYVYQFRLFLDVDDDADWPTFEWVEVEYESHNYRQTL